MPTPALAADAKPRVNITLTDDDNVLLIKLRSKLELHSSRRISMSEVVRVALRKLAEAEGIATNDAG